MTDEDQAMKHTMKLEIVTEGPAPYGHKTWSEAVEAILIGELAGLRSAKVLEDWV